MSVLENFTAFNFNEGVPYASITSNGITFNKSVHLQSLKDQRKQFQMLVESKFYEWLIQTGNRQQLDSLVPPAVGSKQAAG